MIPANISERNKPIVHNGFQKILQVKTLFKSFYEARITPIQKTGNDTKRKVWSNILHIQIQKSQTKNIKWN